jgi:hypothetical protein
MMIGSEPQEAQGLMLLLTIVEAGALVSILTLLDIRDIIID